MLNGFQRIDFMILSIFYNKAQVFFYTTTPNLKSTAATSGFVTTALFILFYLTTENQSKSNQTRTQKQKKNKRKIWLQLRNECD